MTVKKAIEKSVGRYHRAFDFEWHAYWRSRPIAADTVLYESFSGNGMLCNPRAIFEALLDDPRHAGLRHTWVLDSEDAVREARTRWPRRVRFVLKGSRAYYRALATSQYLVNNATFPPQFSKRPGQVYLNTWHGTPLKKMGYDMPGGGSESRNVLRNFVMADHLVSSSPFMTEQMYLTGYKLRGIFRGQILESGLPRIDQQLADGARDRARAALVGAGIDIGDRKVVLYAPTWRGSFYRPRDETEGLLNVVEAIQEEVGDDCVVLLKTHQVAYRYAAENSRGSGLVVPNEIPTNEVLAASDVVVTDYSSIFFDALPTRTPIAFYMPDSGQYDDTRGLYERLDDLPGPVVRSLYELGRTVAGLVEGGLGALDETRAAAYERFVATYAPHEDGRATRRVVETVFGGQESGVVHRDLDGDGRTSILLYVGGLKSNGITSSVLNLLAALDPARYDVSAFYGAPRNQDERKNEGLIPSHVRLFPRVGGFNGSKWMRTARRALFDGLDEGHEKVDRAAMQAYFADEWYRCFGDSRFDHVVDFSGYGPMWPNILLASPSGTKSIWLHNDVLADSQREVDGRRHLEHLLRAVFSTYRQFDHLVSVSESLAQINADKLSEYAPSGKFMHARNLMDVERIRSMSGIEADLEPLRAPAVDEHVGVNLQADLSLLADLYTVDRVAEEWVRQSSIRAAFRPTGEGPRFICLGRLSPEKNHARLIDAFARVVSEYPDAQLGILGSGPLGADLQAQVERLGLTGNVRLAGFQANPYAALAAADCFVLSSDYEGQPMVILEARTLGIPVITTRFGSAESALAPDEGLIVPCDADALADAMLTFVKEGIPHKPFDVGQYNEAALAEFLRAIGAAERPAA